MTDSNRALSRFFVLDLTTVRSGPTCTKILADFGATVLRVERPGGESQERQFYDSADLHRNKRSIAINLQDSRGVEIVRKLARRADVVVMTIFVNPLQFGPSEDFSRYPRTLKQDLDLLAPLGVDAVFLPNASTM